MSQTTHVTQPIGQKARSQPSDGSGQQKKGGDGEGTLVVPKPRLALNTQPGFRLAVTHPPTKNMSFPERKRVGHDARGQPLSGSGRQ